MPEETAVGALLCTSSVHSSSCSDDVTEFVMTVQQAMVYPLVSLHMVNLFRDFTGGDDGVVEDETKSTSCRGNMVCGFVLLLLMMICG